MFIIRILFFLAIFSIKLSIQLTSPNPAYSSGNLRLIGRSLENTTTNESLPQAGTGVPGATIPSSAPTSVPVPSGGIESVPIVPDLVLPKISLSKAFVADLASVVPIA